MSNDPKWLTRARWYNGVVETKVPQHNPKIMHLLDVADGKDASGNIVVLGGNQGRRVKLSSYDSRRVVGFVRVL